MTDEAAAGRNAAENKRFKSLIKDREAQNTRRTADVAVRELKAYLKKKKKQINGDFESLSSYQLDVL